MVNNEFGIELMNANIPFFKPPLHFVLDMLRYIRTVFAIGYPERQSLLDP